MDKTPRHVAIIMDGNGRWAKARSKERIYGHMQGAESVRTAVKAALKNSVEYLTLYAFSTENWGRPKDEIAGLMELFCRYTASETPELKKQGVKVLFIGDRENLSEEVRRSIEYTASQTADCNKLTLVIALDYSGRWDIAQMTRNIVRKAATGEIDPERIDERTIACNLATTGIPDPDLLIRTSGECRLSNFLLWQCAYSELYFTDVLWPDFSQNDFEDAINEYKQRNRRFGLI